MATAVLLLAWAIAYLCVGNELLVPSLSDCVKEVGKLVISGSFWAGFAWSLLRAFVAFVISFVVALAFGIVGHIYPKTQGFFAPVVAAFRSLPVLAVLLILLSIFSAGIAPIAVAFLSLFPMLYTGILAGLSCVDEKLVEVAKVYGASNFAKAFGLYLPLSSPYILREAGGALSFSVKLVVSAEVLASTARSLGGMMLEAKAYAEVARLFALVFVAFVVGLIVELLFTAISKAVERRVK